MELYLKGIHPDVLGSPRDVIFRQHAMNEIVQESRKLMAGVAGSLGNSQAAKQILQEYASSLFDTPQTKQRRHADMLKYYNQHVRHVVPEARLVTDGHNKYLKVSGLEELNG